MQPTTANGDPDSPAVAAVGGLVAPLLAPVAATAAAASLAAAHSAETAEAAAQTCAEHEGTPELATAVLTHARWIRRAARAVALGEAVETSYELAPKCRQLAATAHQQASQVLSLPPNPQLLLSACIGAATTGEAAANQCGRAAEVTWAGGEAALDPAALAQAGAALDASRALTRAAQRALHRASRSRNVDDFRAAAHAVMALSHQVIEVTSLISFSALKIAAHEMPRVAIGQKRWRPDHVALWVRDLLALTTALAQVIDQTALVHSELRKSRTSGRSLAAACQAVQTAARAGHNAAQSSRHAALALERGRNAVLTLLDAGPDGDAHSSVKAALGRLAGQVASARRAAEAASDQAEIAGVTAQHAGTVAECARSAEDVLSVQQQTLAVHRSVEQGLRELLGVVIAETAAAAARAAVSAAERIAVLSAAAREQLARGASACASAWEATQVALHESKAVATAANPNSANLTAVLFQDQQGNLHANARKDIHSATALLRVMEDNETALAAQITVCQEAGRIALAAVSDGRPVPSAKTAVLRASEMVQLFLTARTQIRTANQLVATLAWDSARAARLASKTALIAAAKMSWAEQNDSDHALREASEQLNSPLDPTPLPPSAALGLTFESTAAAGTAAAGTKTPAAEPAPARKSRRWPRRDLVERFTAIRGRCLDLP